MVWVDEAGFGLLPGRVRTYAPCGQTPILRGKLTRDHLSVVGALTETGKVYLQVQTHPVTGACAVRFLQHLLRQIPGQLLVLWDGLPAHRSRRVREFLSAGAAARLLLERLPGYAPELNPVEDLWHYLKHVELRNCCFPDLDHLWDGLLHAVARVRHRASVLQGFLRHVGYIFRKSGADQ